MPSPKDIKTAESFVDQNYPIIQYNFVETITEHLADCSRVFDGDLQQVLLLGLIGQVHLEHHRRNDGDVQHVRGLSASRLSDVTGIPRQTVRRKLAILAGRGWIEETTPGSWRIKMADHGSVARQDLAGLDHRNIQRMARFVSSLVPLISKHF